ncbi:M15 family metallopeptidase [Ihubacter sp. mB4P-1]|uniref:M15 family metallopeptidase n=1 Tax=Ihubacter sp. mB4P-1 TaxID=3242370 RepID=UPI00137B52B0
MTIRQYGNLVRLLDLDEDFIIDLIYATPNNFTGSVVYDSPECFIDIATAKRLIAAKDLVKKDGLRMKVWDAFRPVSAQQRFWDLLPDNDFVAYPPDMAVITEFKNSHMNGQCVDVTLTDTNGKELLMPSAFDDFTQKARLDCPETSGEALKNAIYLREIMMQAGFTPYIGEWWHFYDKNPTPARYTETIPK